MKKILIMDEHNYPENYKEIYRVSPRAIIFIDKKMLFIKAKSGFISVPGGGQEEGETEEEALIREVLEETGYHVIKSSIREFGEVEEKRLSTKEPMIWHQINRYYFCDVEKEHDKCMYTENELQYDFKIVFYSLDEAIQISEDIIKRDDGLQWNRKVVAVLKLIKEYIEKING